ncbi:MAG: glycoside hydrolase family 78 protein [Acidobacteriota bacterium]|nr:glycoside hydrolase family 78 protein [Acidobacteriota bacterium]
MSRTRTGLDRQRLSSAVVFAIVLTAVLLPQPATAAGPGKAAVVTSHLECDHLVEPLGLDDLHPQLSWQMQSTRPGAAQTAYQIKVATTRQLLQQNHPDLWDSGRVASSLSVAIPYSGTPLLAGKRYFWTVQVWDEHGAAIHPSQPSWWEMALLKPSDWQATWISNDPPQDRDDRASAPAWIWTAGEDALTHAKAGKHPFRFRFDLKQRPTEATLLITGKDDVSAAINGKEILHAAGAAPWGGSLPWGTFHEIKIEPADLQPGSNVLAAEATVLPNQGSFAGLVALLRLRMPDGTTLRYVTGPSWKTSEVAPANWQATDFNDSQWHAAAVAAPLGETPLGTPWPPKPASLFRKDFVVAKAIRSARLYVTALGSYQMRLNGQPVGKDVLAPGWTDYKARVFYQTYDVTSMLHPGANALGALLGDGWYASGLTWTQQRFNFGPPPLRLLAQLNVEYTDGSHDVVKTDPGWTTSTSAIRTSDLYNGENYDARDEQPGWDKPAFQPASAWAAATASDAPPAQILAQNFQPIEVEQQLPAKALTNPSPGVYLFDLGQNMVGTERLRVSGTRGATIRLRFGEVLQPDGQLYHQNMRSADETDTYTLAGGREEIFIPHFTYHGFRYVELTGYPGKPALDAITGIVFHTAAPFTIHFDSGSPTINKLWSNILWGQRGNFESIPTDCPQRDERLGWMGDAQVFWRTASYNMDLGAFSEKFAADMRVAQSSKGNFADVTPRIGTAVGDGSPGWADAGVIIPYTAWRQFGDTRILTQSWDSMERYLALLLEENPSYISHRTAYGDWLAIGSTTPQDLIATAYWAYDTHLMSAMAQALDRPEDARRYEALFAKIKAAFQQRFVKPDGSVGSNSQTSYVLALHMNLLPEAQRLTVADRLVADIEAHQGHLTTGFLGTPYIMSVLSSTGHSDAAYKLLLTDTYPSWAYMVQHGATTMWERWNGNQMLNDPSMNSFNHYAYGSVAEWLYRFAAGVDLGPDPNDPNAQAFHHFVLHPQFSPSLGRASASYDSPYGTIRSSWTYTHNAFEWQATIPANTSATLSLPPSTLLNGHPITSRTSGLTPVPSTSPATQFEAAPGTYRFTVPAASASSPHQQ